MRVKSLILGDQPGVIPAVCAACLAAVVACGSPADEERLEEADTTAAVDMVPRAADVDSEPDTAATTVSGLRAELEALAGTDVTGTVSLTPGAGGTTVSVQIHGANSGLPYVAEIVSGSCTSPGAVLEEIGRITGVAMETAKSRLRYALGKLRGALRQHQSPNIQARVSP